LTIKTGHSILNTRKEVTGDTQITWSQSATKFQSS